MVRLVVLMVALALAMSACIDFSGFPDSGTPQAASLSASDSVADVGEPIVFTAEFDTGSARIWIGETEVDVESGALVRELPVLGSDATITVMDANTATLSVPLPSGNSEALGRTIYRFDDESRTYLAFGGSRSTLTASTPISIRTEEEEFVRDGIQSATFSIVRTGSGDEPSLETISIGEAKTVSLDGESAQLEIIDYTMVEGELSQLTLRARYSVPILGEQSIDLDFTFTTGKQINLGLSGTFDVFLRDVSYSVTPTGTAQILLVSGSDEAAFVIGEPVALGSRVVFPLELSSGSSLSASVLIDPEIIMVEDGSAIRFPDEPLDVSVARSADRFSFTDTSGADQLFSAYALEPTGSLIRVIDTQSAQRTSSTSTSATYVFRVPGEYTARLSVSEDGVVTGEAEADVLIR